MRSRRGAYRAVLANLGVPSGELAWATERVESGLIRTLRDPRGRWVLDNHADAASELPIAGLIDGNLCEAVIDRTFIDENGVRWIIDYKTSVHEGAGLENFLEKEKERYREQLERYARLMVQREMIPCGIQFGWACIFHSWADGWNGARRWSCIDKPCCSSFSRLLKKAFGDRLPHGRGSVNTCKHAVAILSRAREQAVYGLFQRPVSNRYVKTAIADVFHTRGRSSAG